MFHFIKKIAYQRVTRTKDEIPLDEMEAYIKEWWSVKYNLPKNHPLLLELTFEELLVEYFVDTFRRDEDELKKFQLELEGKHIDSDEEWLMKEMGDDYKPPEVAKEFEFNENFTD